MVSKDTFPPAEILTRPQGLQNTMFDLIPSTGLASSSRWNPPSPQRRSQLKHLTWSTMDQLVYSWRPCNISGWTSMIGPRKKNFQHVGLLAAAFGAVCWRGLCSLGNYKVEIEGVVEISRWLCELPFGAERIKTKSETTTVCVGSNSVGTSKIEGYLYYVDTCNEDNTRENTND